MHIEEPAIRNFISVDLQSQLPLRKTSNTKQLLTSLQIALLNTGLGLWEWNLVSSDLNFDSCSQRILGYKADEIKNRTIFDKLIHPHDISRVIQKRKEHFSYCTSQEVEFRILSKSGWKSIIERVVAVYHDDNSSIVSVIGTYEDVTLRKAPLQLTVQSLQAREVLLNQITQIIDTSLASELESTLQSIASKLRLSLRSQQVAICSIHNNDSTVASDFSISSIDPNYKDSNNSTIAVPIFIRNFNIQGAATKERVFWGMLIVHCSGLMPRSEITTLKLVAREIGTAIGTAQLLRKLQTDSTSQTVEAQANNSLQQIEQEIEQQSLYLAQIQTQLLSKEQKATLGQLIVDLVKEIYDPVEFIFNALSSANQYALDLIQLLEHYQHCYPIPSFTIPPHLQSLDIDFIKTDFIKLLWSLQAGSERLQHTVRALHTFSLDDGKIKKINLNHALSGAITILQRRLKQQKRPTIEVIKEFGDIPLVECLPSELNQVFISLLINAIEALEERMNYDFSFTPKIWVSTEIVRSHLSVVDSINIQTKRPKQKVLIHIYDNGRGILPHVQRRMFEPFFTTKPNGKGIGLGLAISRQIIEQNHRGKLRCNSQLGHGTEFVIEISTLSRHYTDIKKHAGF